MDLFQPSRINNMTLANRFVRSATWEGMAADDGAVTPKLVETMEALARGGVGLIITGHAYVLPQGQAGPWQLGIYSDGQTGGLKTMTDAVHKAGGKIVVQLAHAGHFAIEKLTGTPPWVASAYGGLSDTPRHEMSKGDISDLVAAFASAAARAKAAGFDGVQIHSAHGYLLSQFLSPEFNRRTDEYGGSIENRSRLHMEVLRAIRDAVGGDYPVLIKINCRDFQENGLTPEESLYVCKRLADNGLDAIELSGGTLTGGKLSPSRTGITSTEKEAYFKEEAAAVRKEIDIPLILVGGLRSLEIANEMVDQGRADYISMCRPLIREPGLVNRWRSGDTAPALCKSDNLCFRPAMAGKGVYCVVEEREKSKE
ncbi:MAG: NADH:flavin oxidoreductase [Desulfobacteraceae bacterium]|nr:NADH:flavin oxidoreductase [Desulfobacteraceae bacterium]